MGMKLAWVLIGGLSLFSTRAVALTEIDEKGMMERLAACAACHGERGEGAPGTEYYPHLAGKPAGYLFAQMQGFRDGRRHYPQMVYLMRHWDDVWLARIAQFYADQPIETLTHAPLDALTGEALSRAETVVFHGDEAQQLPACATCHGPQLQGMEPGVPALAGLPVDYLIAQLGGWVTGVRHSVAPDCMAHVVKRLQPGDIRVVSSYLAGLVPEAGTKPLPAQAMTFPLDCGGATHFDVTTGDIR